MIYLVFHLVRRHLSSIHRESYSTDDSVVHRNVLNIQHNQYIIVYFHSLVSENVIWLETSSKMNGLKCNLNERTHS